MADKIKSIFKDDPHELKRLIDLAKDARHIKKVIDAKNRELKRLKDLAEDA